MNLKFQKIMQIMQIMVAGASSLVLAGAIAAPSAFSLSQDPMFVPSSTTPNVLLAFDTSWSMLNEITDTTYKGATNTNSKAQIAFSAAQNFVNANKGKINLGLMTYKYQGANLTFISGDYDYDHTLASGGSTETTKIPFRLTAYPSGTGIDAAAYDNPSNTSLGKKRYSFQPGELIHLRYAIVNRGPEKSIKPQFVLHLPTHMVLSGYDTGTQTYSGFKSVFSQHPSGQWVCHSPPSTAASGGITKGSQQSPSTPYGQTPALDQKILCDTDEINANETVFLELYVYWSGYGGGVNLRPQVYIKDTQCNSTADCNAVTATPRDPVQSVYVYNGKFVNDVSPVGMSSTPMAAGIGFYQISPIGTVGTPATTTTYTYIVNNTGSTFNQPLTYSVNVDIPQGGTTTYPSNSSGNRLTMVSAKQVSYSSACGNPSNPACYTTVSASPWTCSQSNYITSDTLGSPTPAYRGFTCTRNSGMPPTTASAVMGTSEIIQIDTQTNSGITLSTTDVGKSFKSVHSISSPSDTTHVLDPAYNGGPGYPVIAPNPTIGTCSSWITVNNVTTTYVDALTPPIVSGSFSGSPSYCHNPIGFSGPAISAAGLAGYTNYATPGGGNLLQPISFLNAARAATYTDPNTGIFQCNLESDVENAATTTVKCNNNGMTFFYDTPIAGTLNTANHYFAQTLSANENGTGQALSDLNTVGGSFPNMPQNACGQKYMILLTDGNPTIDAAGNKYANTNAATWDAVQAAQNLYNQGVTLYVIAFGSGATKASADAIAQAGSGGTCSNSGSVSCTGGTPAYAATSLTSLNSAFTAIAAKFAVKSGGSALSLGKINNVSGAGNYLFKTTFNTNQWDGNLLGFGLTNGKVNATADWSLSDNIENTQRSGSVAVFKRNFFTAKRPSIANGDSPGVSKGIPWVWPSNPASPSSTEMNVWQTNALNKNESGSTDAQGSLRLNWLRGDASNEGNGSGQFRQRAAALGDIINSTPLYVGAPQDGSIKDASYATFRSTYKNRMPMVYVGSNDGMLHGVKAGLSGYGMEYFNFTPSFIYSKLPQLMRQDYGSNHVYTVDGSPTAGDVLLPSDGQWHTLLASGVNAGGRGYFALDITQPGWDNAAITSSSYSSSGTCASTPATCLSMEETTTNANKLLKWEFTSENSHSGTLNSSGVPSGIVTGDSDLGFTFSKPVVGRIAMGSGAPYISVPVVIFGNGYNNTDTTMGSASSTGYGALYIVNADTGYLIRKIIVPIGSVSVPNGLGTPLAIDEDKDGNIDRIYAGDLYGHVWRFNLYSGVARNAGDFEIAFSGNPLYKATDGSGNARPITGELKAAYHPVKGFMILFGSGQFLAKTDIKSSYTSVDEDAFYSVWDRDESTYLPLTSDPRQFLNGNHVQECNHVTNVGDTQAASNACLSASDAYLNASTYIKTTSNSTPKTMCGVSADPATGCAMGCYLEFKNIPTSGYFGERSIYAPYISGKSVQVNSIIPPANACSITDSGMTMEYIFDYISCQPLNQIPYDINHDGKFDLSDIINSVSGGSFKPSGSIVSGLVPPGVHVPSYGGPTTIYDSSSINTGMPSTNFVSIQNAGGRVSWREIQPHLMNQK